MRALPLSAILLAVLTAGAPAHDFRVGALEIARPWSRATPKGATVAGGYLKIINKGTAPDRLIGGSAEVAKRFELHEMRMNDGVMRMRELKGGLDIPPGATVELKPGSYHVMLTGLTRPLAKGEKLKGTLTFEKAGKVDVEFTVEDIGANPHRH